MLKWMSSSSGRKGKSAGLKLVADGLEAADDCLRFVIVEDVGAP